MTNSLSKKEPLGAPAMWKYGAGDIGINFYWQGAGFFLLFFYTDIVGLPNTTAGVVYALGGIVDALTDPLMGLIADRTRSKWGRYRPYLLFGAAPLGVSFVLLFSLPSFVSPELALWAAIITHIVFRIAYTIVSIPYGALGARLSFDARERTSIAGVRMLCGAIGGVLIVFAATALRSTLADRSAFLWTSILAAFAGALLICVAFAGTIERRIRRADSELPTVRSYPAGEILSSILRNRPFLILTASLFFLTIANMIIVKTTLYRFEHMLHAPKLGGLTMTLMTAAPLIAIPCWIFIYHRFEKRVGYLLGCVMVCISLAVLLAAGGESRAGAAVAYVAAAASFSSFAVGFWGILPDTIDYGHWKSGIRIESGLVGLASAIQKMAIALAGLGVGVALDMIGYRAGADLDAGTLAALHNFSSIIPIILMLLTGAIIAFYPISASAHGRMVAEIVARES